jgi:hypothetical protein
MLDNLDLMLTIPGAQNKKIRPLLLRAHDALSTFREIVSTVFSNTVAENREFLVKEFQRKYMLLKISVTTKVSYKKIIQTTAK